MSSGKFVGKLFEKIGRPGGLAHVSKEGGEVHSLKYGWSFILKNPLIVTWMDFDWRTQSGNYRQDMRMTVINPHNVNLLSQKKRYDENCRCPTFFDRPS
ncbi:MAG: hypothetical protein QXP17_02130 [Candidatus Jordarchaeales archaeon]